MVGYHRQEALIIYLSGQNISIEVLNFTKYFSI